MKWKGRVSEYQKEYGSVYNKTFNGVISRLYRNMKHREIRDRGKNLTFTKDEFVLWFLNQSYAKSCFVVWKLNDYSSESKPSIDRVNNNLGYYFDNMNLTTWGENKRRENRDVKNCKSSRNLKPVIATSIKTGEAMEFPSAAFASRKLGADVSKIAEVCKGANKFRHTHKGYKWTYK